MLLQLPELEALLGDPLPMSAWQSLFIPVLKYFKTCVYYINKYTYTYTQRHVFEARISEMPFKSKNEGIS